MSKDRARKHRLNNQRKNLAPPAPRKPKHRMTKAEATGVANQLVKTLAPLWKKSLAAHLELRHRTGREINAALGQPSQRLKYGHHILETCADRLQIEVTELSRMRWFAHYYPTFAAFTAKHAEDMAWSEVRTLLKDLRAKDPNLPPRKARKPRPASAQLHRAIQSITTLSQRLQGETLRPEDAEYQELEAAVTALIQAAQDRLGTDRWLPKAASAPIASAGTEVAPIAAALIPEKPVQPLPPMPPAAVPGEAPTTDDGVPIQGAELDGQEEQPGARSPVLPPPSAEENRPDTRPG